MGTRTFWKHLSLGSKRTAENTSFPGIFIIINEALRAIPRGPCLDLLAEPVGWHPFLPPVQRQGQVIPNCSFLRELPTSLFIHPGNTLVFSLFGV